MKNPKYMELYNHIVSQLANGVYGPGSQLPTEVEYTKEFNVSRITVKKAMEILTSKNLITRVAGKGSFVSNNVYQILQDKNIITQSDHFIGVMMSGMSDAFGIKFFNGLQSESNKNGYSLLLHMSYDSQEAENAGIRRLISSGVKGIIIMAVHGENYNPVILRQAIDGFPLVLVDIYLNGLSVPFIGTNNIGASRKLTEHLFSLGHSNILFVASMATTSAIIERKDGYISAYANNKMQFNPNNIYLDIKCTMPGKGTPEIINSEVDRLKTFIASHPKTTAIIAADYNVACLVKKSLHEMNKDIPNDISIVCFDEPETPYKDSFFTHIRQNEFEMGVQAVQLLLENINDNITNEKILIDAELITGKSTKSNK